MLESEQNFYQGREQLMVKIKERRGVGILETIIRAAIYEDK